MYMPHYPVADILPACQHAHLWFLPLRIATPHTHAPPLPWLCLCLYFLHCIVLRCRTFYAWLVRWFPTLPDGLVRYRRLPIAFYYAYGRFACPPCLPVYHTTTVRFLLRRGSPVDPVTVVCPHHPPYADVTAVVVCHCRCTRGSPPTHFTRCPLLYFNISHMPPLFTLLRLCVVGSYYRPYAFVLYRRSSVPLYVYPLPVPLSPLPTMPLCHTWLLPLLISQLCPVRVYTTFASGLFTLPCGWLPVSFILVLVYCCLIAGSLVVVFIYCVACHLCGGCWSSSIYCLAMLRPFFAHTRFVLATLTFPARSLFLFTVGCRIYLTHYTHNAACCHLWLPDPLCRLVRWFYLLPTHIFYLPPHHHHTRRYYLYMPAHYFL